MFISLQSLAHSLQRSSRNREKTEATPISDKNNLTPAADVQRTASPVLWNQIPENFQEGKPAGRKNPFQELMLSPYSRMKNFECSKDGYTFLSPDHNPGSQEKEGSQQSKIIALDNHSPWLGIFSFNTAWYLSKF